MAELGLKKQTQQQEKAQDKQWMDAQIKKRLEEDKLSLEHQREQQAQYRQVLGKQVDYPLSVHRPEEKAAWKGSSTVWLPKL